MPAFDVLCLARSYKRRGACVAGLRLDGGGWIRPVAQTSSGELYPIHYILDDSSCPKVLDVIRIPCERPAASQYQPENWLLGKGRWQLRSRGHPEEFAPLLWKYLYTGSTLLGDNAGRIAFETFAQKPAQSSLALIQPRNLRWAIQRTAGNVHNPRALFELDGMSYRLPVTDPAFMDTFRSLPLGIHPEKACGTEGCQILLTISLGEPWEDGYCYKLATAIVTLPQGLLAGAPREPLPSRRPPAAAITITPEAVAPSGVRREEAREESRALHHAGKAWKPEEEEQLLREFDAGETIAAIARSHARTPVAIRFRLIRLGRLEESA